MQRQGLALGLREQAEGLDEPLLGLGTRRALAGGRLLRHQVRPPECRRCLGPDLERPLPPPVSPRTALVTPCMRDRPFQDSPQPAPPLLLAPAVEPLPESVRLEHRELDHVRW